METSSLFRSYFKRAFGLTAASMILFGGVGYMALATPPTGLTSPTAGISADKAIEGLEYSGKAFSAIAKRISPAVVSLKV